MTFPLIKKKIVPDSIGKPLVIYGKFRAVLAIVGGAIVILLSFILPLIISENKLKLFLVFFIVGIIAIIYGIVIIFLIKKGPYGEIK